MPKPITYAFEASSRDQELAVIEVILLALDELKPDAHARVLDYIRAREANR